MKNNSIKFVIMALLFSVITMDLISIPSTCEQCFIGSCSGCSCNDGTLTCTQCSNDARTGTRATTLSNLDINKAIFNSSLVSDIILREVQDRAKSIINTENYKNSSAYRQISSYMQYQAGIDVCSDEYSAKYVKNYNGKLVALIPDPSNPNLTIADATAWGN